jgi:hypothetical protein
MWLNFLDACRLGTVISAADTTVWQKVGSRAWHRVGAAGDYDACSISWPVDVLAEGIA